MGDKKIFYVAGIILLVLILVVVLILFRNPWESKTTSPLFEQYLKEAKEIKSLQAEYVSTSTILVDSNSTTIQIKGKSYKKDKNRREDIEIVAPDGKSFLFRSYLLGGKLFACPDLTGNCKETETIISLSEENAIKMITEIYQKKAITFTEGKDKVVEGKSCKELSMIFDISKLSQKEKYFLLASSGLINPPQPEKYAESITSFSTSSCIAKGMDLDSYSILALGKDKNAIFQNHLTINNYQLNAELPDSLFFPNFN